MSRSGQNSSAEQSPEPGSTQYYRKMATQLQKNRERDYKLEYL